MNSFPDPTHFIASDLCSDVGTDLKHSSTADSNSYTHTHVQYILCTWQYGIYLALCGTENLFLVGG